MKKVLKYTGIGLLVGGTTVGTIKLVKNWDKVKAYIKDRFEKKSDGEREEVEIELPPPPKPQKPPITKNQKPPINQDEPREVESDHSRPIIRKEILEGKEKV